MEKDEYPKMKGIVTYVLRDKDGNIKHKDTSTNIIPVTGRTEVMRLVSGQGSPTAFGYLAIGSGNTAPAPSDTALETELARVASTNSEPGTPEPFTARYWGHFNAGVGTGTIWEAGVLNAASDGVLHARNVRPSGLVKGATDILDVYYDIVY